MTIRGEYSPKTTWKATAMFSSVVVLALTLCPDSTANTYNLIPMREHGPAWSCVLRMCPGAAESARFLIVDVLGNVAVFLPIGLTIAGAASGTRWSRFRLAIGLGALLSLLIELTQFGISTRATDVDDLIFNTLGAALGAGLFLIWRSWSSRPV